ncbi:MAG: RNA polymerase-binding protein DksA [Ramlibacter sp.]|nr:RNA polymerase-binding protein DksA [Ramlibacter sp.]
MKASPKATKPAAKTKAATRPAAKPAVKSATQSPAKAAKPPAKNVTKPVAKAVKAPAKTATKAATKVAAKPVPKPAAKKISTPVKKAAAPVTKPAIKKPDPSSKTAPAAVSAPVTSKPKAAAAGSAVSAKVPEKSTPVATKAATAPTVHSRAMPPRPDAATTAQEPARAAKPSARLAQITVPSMAQSVASTAAKASYIQTMADTVLTPPPIVAVKKDPKLANNWKTKSAAELTDAEVMAMADTEYMNDKQMAFFRLKLTVLKDEILASAGETTEHLREDTVIVPDPADRATIEEEHALELRTRDRERKLLKKIEQSIARIDAGDYGYCDETGEPIGVGRLLARPTATLSLEAQQRRELKQKMFGD